MKKKDFLYEHDPARCRHESASYRHVDTGIIMRGNSYRFTVYMGYTPYGRQIRKTTTFVPPSGISLKAGDRLAREKYIEYKIRVKGLSQFNENMKFKDLCSDYIEHYVRIKLKETTAYNYEHQINAHFIEPLGNKRLKNINSALISGLFSDMNHLSRGTKKNCLQYLNPCFRMQSGSSI